MKPIAKMLLLFLFLAIVLAAGCQQDTSSPPVSAQKESQEEVDKESELETMVPESEEKKEREPLTQDEILTLFTVDDMEILSEFEGMLFYSTTETYEEAKARCELALAEIPAMGRFSAIDPLEDTVEEGEIFRGFYGGSEQVVVSIYHLADHVEISIEY